MGKLTLDSFTIMIHEISKYWVVTQDDYKYYIGETESKKFITFSFFKGIEEDDYNKFDSYKEARENLKRNYNIEKRMKRIF